MFAAASLADALAEIGTAWEAASGHRAVFNFGASSDLARQIRAGAPADVFFSADAAQMDALEQRGAGARGRPQRPALEHARRDRAAALDGARQRARASSPQFESIAIADPQAVPAGVYARTWLEGLGLWDAARAAGRADAPRARGARRRRVRATPRPASSTGPTRPARSARGSRSRCRREQGPPIRYPVAPLATLGPSGRGRVRRVPALARRARGLHPPRLPGARRAVAC